MSIIESLLTWLQSSWKHFEVYIRDNRKFDFRQIWKFCWGLSNVISGGNWLFRWDCVFSGGTLYSSANYELTWHMYIVFICICLAHYIFKKNEGGRELKQISTYKICYEIKKISTFLLSVEQGKSKGVCNFYKKNKLKSEMLKSLTTKKVDNFSLSLLIIQTRKF